MYKKLAMALLGSVTLHAIVGAQTTIYDTTGGNLAFTYPAYQIGPDPIYAFALGFNVSSGADLSNINVYLSPNNVGGYKVQLAEAGAGQPGPVLDTWSTPGSPGEITLTPNGVDALAAGNYDVVVSSSYVGGWSINYAAQGTFEFVGVDGTWVTSSESALPEMKVQVASAATPEPASMIALGSGIFGLVARRRASRTARRTA